MKKEILIVEDNKINRRMLSRIVSSEYEVIEAANGQEALEVLEREYARIELILLDIVMPVMDGYAFLEEQKKNVNFASIPVIVTTEHHSEREEIKALTIGATEFVVKPYQPQIIMNRINSIMKLRETAAMVYQLQYDRLTGLYCKDYFYQRAREIRAENPQVVYDFICTNIENFHLFNDRYGTEAGDELLQEIAAIYKRVIPGGQALTARFYADHFVGMAERGSGVADDMIRKVMSELCEKYGNSRVTLKWGIYTDDGEDIPVEKMCDNATLAARSISGQYGVHYARFDQNLKDSIVKEQTIIDEMEQALEEEQFEVYLQPKVRMDEARWMDAEALVRWNHPQKGILSPAVFIPVFERTRFITKLDRYVWRKTCELLRQWEEQGLGRISVSVNMSRADAADDGLTDYLENLVKEYQIQPSQLHLEITETACMENPGEMIELIGKLRERGFVIEMDDFGSGYSSINMLTQMPLDILKLDRILIQNEFKRKGSLNFIIGLAHWLDLKVVAEGVETKEQMDYMIELGCDYIQGYYTAKPMAWREFEQSLKKQSGRQE